MGKMNPLNLSLQHLSIVHLVIIMCLTAITALASHLGKASYNDGIRPIVPEIIEGRMKRSELASASFGLSIGMFVSVGLSFTFSFQLLNAWLLFLPTDILGIMAVNWWMAAGLGAIWGLAITLVFAGAHSWFMTFPIDFFGALGELSTPVLIALAVIPIVAILYQFGKMHALISGIVLLVIRQLLPDSSGGMLQLSVLMILGTVFIIIFALWRDFRLKRNNPEPPVEEEPELYSEQRRRLFKGLPLLALTGGLVAVACNLGLFTGSDVAAPILHQAWASEGEQQTDLLRNAAIADVIRGIGYLPLLATTGLVTGVSSLLGLTFIYPIGYLSPNPYVAGLLGMLWICLEVAVLRRLVGFIERYPTLRESSDHIRTAMNTVLELALFIGGILAVMKLSPSASGLPLMLYVLLYLVNEGLGRPVIRIAAGPVAVIFTGIILNVLYVLHLL
jgi:hypothetical protein